MSSGTLYGAKLTQLSDVYGGEFNVSWISLGHGTQAEVEQMVTDKVTFSQIFDVMPYTAAIGCIEGFKSISKRDNALGAQCLKLKVSWGHNLRSGCDQHYSRDGLCVGSGGAVFVCNVGLICTATTIPCGACMGPNDDTLITMMMHHD